MSGTRPAGEGGPLCETCGRRVASGARVCPSCGAERGGALPSPAAADEPTTSDVSIRIDKLSVEPADVSGDAILARAELVRFRGREHPAIGRMVLLARLGRGGMGVVYFGVHPRLGIEVAVKILAVQGATRDEAQHVQRFLREARLAAQLRSDHLVSVLDVDRDEATGLHYIVMEYVRGTSAYAWLDAHRRTGQRVSEREALDVCIAATRGLAVAHEAGIVHRDVKPDNVLLPTGADGAPLLAAAKLADLGLARNETSTGSVTAVPGTMGSPGFMAPEQADGRAPASRASDVFGMGATLHALLAGESPFSGPTPMAAILKTVNGEYKPIRELRAGVSEATAEVIRRCLEPEPTARFPNAGALLAQLEACRAALPAHEAQLDALDEDATRDIRAQPASRAASSSVAPPRGRGDTHAAPENRPPTASPREPTAQPAPTQHFDRRPEATAVAPAPPPSRAGLFIAIAAVVVVAAAAVVAVLVLRNRSTPDRTSGEHTTTEPGPGPAAPDPGPQRPTPTLPPTSGSAPAPEPPIPTPEPEDPGAVQDPGAAARVEAARLAEEARQRAEAEAAVRRERVDATLTRARGLVAEGRPVEALAEFVAARRDAEGFDDTQRSAARDGVREAVRAALDTAQTQRQDGRLDDAAALLESLRSAAAAAALGVDDGYDATLVTTRVDALRRAREERSAGRAALDQADALVASGDFEGALRAYRSAQRNATARDEATRGIEDTLRRTARRGHDRDTSGEHAGARDDLDLVLREKAALPADGSVDLVGVVLDLAEACLSLGETRRAEAALAQLAADDAAAPRAVAVAAKLGLAKNGGDEWPPEHIQRLTALPSEARGRVADAALARAEGALERKGYDAATLDARVALLLIPRSTRAKFVLGASAAARIGAGRRRGSDLETARNQLTTVVNDAKRDASPENQALATKAQALLARLPAN